MKKFNYDYKQVESQQEIEQNSNIPIINIIRHGKTNYKQNLDANFKFDPDDPDFKLDAKHLDLNEEGIKGIQETAEQLEGLIDKENEVVMLVTSPGYRAHSSLLLIEKHLKDKGITILNPDEKIMKTANLDQMKLQDPDMTDEWFAANKEFKSAKPENLTKPAHEAHEGAAKVIGKDLSELLVEDYKGIQRKFNNFVRHMTNIDRYLSDETKQAIEGKRVRIVCLSHEEKPSKFMEDTLDTKENLKNGQILEIQGADVMEKDKPSIAKVTLYEKGEESESNEVVIERNFTEKNN